MNTEIDYYINDPELERYEICDSLSKAYPKLTKESLETMTDILFKFKYNKEDLEYLVHALTKELSE